MSIKNILVPVDFNAHSQAALAVSRDLAADLGASLEVVHVVDLPIDHLPSEGHVPMPADYRRALLEQAHERLDAWMSSSVVPDVPRRIVEGKPAAAIVRFAAEHGAQLIVMGTHGREGLAHLFAGSVTERVVRTAQCPVLTVRPKA